MPVIFISYRRSDSQDVTGRIYDRLLSKYTKKQVFRDIDNIPLGISFPMHLKQVLGKSDVILVIIGRNWTAETDDQGRRRLDDPNDFVRVEVETALRAKVPVIPVLVSNAAMPPASELPQSMRGLVSRNGIAVRPDPDFDNDIDRLLAGIEHVQKLPLIFKSGAGADEPRNRKDNNETAALPKRQARPPRRSLRNLMFFIIAVLFASGVTFVVYEAFTTPPWQDLKPIADAISRWKQKPEPQKDAAVEKGELAQNQKQNPVAKGVADLVKPPDRLHVATNSLGMTFVKLPKGAFYMGGGGGIAGTKAEINQEFEIAIHTVTQGQWQALMGNNPSWFSRVGGGKDKVKDISDRDLRLFPVEMVSWDDAQGFIKKLNEKERASGWTYRLPTKAEWEYACRGGATSEANCSFHFYFDKPTNDLSSTQANFNGEQPFGAGAKGPCLGRTTRVGSYKPNNLGLYDMHGNVCQWCADSCTDGADRVIRGGCFTDNGSICQAAKGYRFAAARRVHWMGFRVVRVPSGGKNDVTEKKPNPPRPDSAALKDVLGMKFVKLPKATFYMGGGGGKAGRKTEIKEDFEIAIYTVTQRQWQGVMGNNPSWFSREGKGKDKVKDIKDEDLKLFPVENVSWDDAQAFIKKLNEKERGSGWTYRLPTEAEWEYACRGGATSEDECSFHFYLDKRTNDLSSTQANFNGDQPFGAGPNGPNLGRTTKVGSYKPNKLGLYDMHGNVGQWCADRPVGASGRSHRGGSWFDKGISCRAGTVSIASWSEIGNNHLGFRLARVPSGSK